MRWHLAIIGVLTFILIVGCTNQSIDLPGSDDMINKSQIIVIESKMSIDDKLVLEKDSIVVDRGERIAIAMAINNILPMKKDFRIILPQDYASTWLSENSYGIIDIKDNDFEILPLIITVPSNPEEDDYGIDIKIEYKEGNEEWKTYEQKPLRLTLRG